MKPLSAERATFLRQSLPGLQTNEPMAKHTSFRLGGTARLFYVAPSNEEIVRAVETAEQVGAPWYVFGSGSNLLVADQGYEGLMIQAGNRALHFEGGQVTSESGAITSLVARKSVEAGLTGFEWAVGVPGTIGGALYGNAGCYGGEMKDVVRSVDAWEVAEKKRIKLTREECGFGYRESRFKHERYVILGCVLELRPVADPEPGRRRIEQIMKERKTKQPLEFSSAGCVFKNYDWQDESELEILRREVDEIPATMLKTRRLSAGWLVDQAGMMGKNIGAIQVSQKHGNFFVNTGIATAADVVALISLVKVNVRDKLGIELQEEVQLVGFE